MREKSNVSENKTCSVKSLFHKIRKPVTHFLDTIWAIGVGLVVGLVSPFPIY